MYDLNIELVKIENMTQPKKVYLDTNLILHWFKLRILKKKKEADDKKIIKFLSKHKEIETFISAFSVAEIVAKLRKEFKDRVTMDEIKEIIEILRNSIKFDTIKLDKFSDMKGQERKGILISPEIIDFAFVCYDASDAIHIDIAKSNDLWFVTRDDDAPRAREKYSKIMGESKFRKQFEKKS